MRSLSNKTVLKKTSGMLVVMLLFAMLTPVLASAAVYFSGTYNSSGSLNGSVYFDASTGNAVYGTHGDTISLTVYGTDGSSKVVSATYDPTQSVSGIVYYNFQTSLPVTSVYSAVYIEYDAANVTSNVYRASPQNPGGPGGWCCGGGGGGGASSTINASGGSVSKSELQNALNNYTEVTIKFTGDTVSLPVGGLLNAQEGAVLIIQNDNGTYYLPLDAFDFEALGESFDTDVEDLDLVVGIKELTGTADAAVETAVVALGGTRISASVDFTLTLKGDNNEELAINSFDRYVKRTIPVTEDSSKPTTVALFNANTNQLSFVPSIVSDDEAEFYRSSNSIYTAIELEKTFSDVVSHWGQSYIERLAGKLIVDGVTDTTFEPDRSITRAEFAAMVIRSLSLNPVTSSSTFNDISSNAWYAGVVGAAAQAGIVDGYEDGSFRPDARITREELAAMVVRAYEYAGSTITIDNAEQNQLLSAWSDAHKIVWGQTEVAKAVKVGLLDGMTNTTLETDGQATRAQTAAMVQRFLTAVNFID